MASHKRLGNNNDCAAHRHFFHSELYDPALLALIFEHLDGRQWQHCRYIVPTMTYGRTWLQYERWSATNVVVEPPVRFVPKGAPRSIICEPLSPSPLGPSSPSDTAATSV
jgi:hypothetical protein